MATLSLAFHPGQMVQTRGIFDACCEHLPFFTFVRSSIARHLQGDWGDEQVLCKSNEAIRDGFICEELQPTGLQQLQDDFYDNDAALHDGGRLFSVYHIPAGLYGLECKLWIITEHDRSATTVLFPSEY
ncbi:MAG: hypothetical protein IPN89_06600 [Saprospiraceae bacterium]|nr:hypothetical protein [Saprospiraceae bacterium]